MASVLERLRRRIGLPIRLRTREVGSGPLPTTGEKGRVPFDGSKPGPRALLRVLGPGESRVGSPTTTESRVGSPTSTEQ